jgi:hypothetical protein
MSQGPYENDGVGELDPMDAVLDPDDEAERGTEYSPDPEDQVDVGNAATPGQDPSASIYDTSWTPPDRPLHRTDFGTTLSEMREGESMESLLSQEEPDVLEQIDAEYDAEDSARQAAEADVEEDPELAAELVAEGGDTDFPAAEFGEVEPRAGRLVAEDEGAHTDTEKDLVARDEGIAGAGASAEEAAVHIIDEP